MRRSLTFLRLVVIFGGMAFLTSCASNRVSERPTDATFCLLECCGAFHEEYHHWPNGFAELSAFAQHSGEWKLGHYEQVQFASLPDGRLSVLDISNGITNRGILTLPPEKKKP